MESEMITQEELLQAQESWKIFKKIDESFETQGVELFKNVFEISPDTLQLFSFKNE